MAETASEDHRPLHEIDDATTLGDLEAAARRSERWGTLPPRTLPSDMVEEVATSLTKDPEAGLDPGRDAMLRHGAG